MAMAARIGAFVVLGIGIPRAARADHAHHDHDHAAATTSSAFGASVSLLAASYETIAYVGDYQGVVPAVLWSDERFGASVGVPLYRLTKNGAQYYGPGDPVVHGQAAVLGDPGRQVGAALSVTLPFGSMRNGLGMGHAMVMPALWGTLGLGVVELTASAGYSRALGSAMEHDHGPSPLVDPMNFSELTWSSGGDLALARSVRVGAQLSGGVPLEGNGNTRLVGGLRFLWSDGRVATSAEIQAGLVGDPFHVRAVVETALRF
jgi:hypothetical protein